MSSRSSSPPIPLSLPKREAAALCVEIEDAFRAVVKGGQYVGGPMIERFEESFAAFCGAEHCVAVANGTDALEIALRALGIGTGDEVITVANAGGYTSTACHMIGAIPVYVDVDPETLQLNPATIKGVLTANCRAIVITHLYGYMNSVTKLRAILDAAGRSDVAVLEDCAQAHGAIRDGQRAGSLGDVAAFSFYPTKNLGALGDGGAIVSTRGEVAERARRLREYGWETKYCTSLPGGRNSRLDPVQAAILSLKLPHLDSYNARRRAICSKYSECLPAEWRIIFDDAPHFVGHLAVLVAPSAAARQRGEALLSGRRIGTGIHYSRLDPDQPAWLGHGRTNTDLPVSRAAAERILTVPCFPHMSDEEIMRVGDAIRSLGSHS